MRRPQARGGSSCRRTGTSPHSSASGSLPLCAKTLPPRPLRPHHLPWLRQLLQPRLNQAAVAAEAAAAGAGAGSARGSKQQTRKQPIARALPRQKISCSRQTAPSGGGAETRSLSSRWPWRCVAHPAAAPHLTCASRPALAGHANAPRNSNNRLLSTMSTMCDWLLTASYADDVYRGSQRRTRQRRRRRGRRVRSATIISRQPPPGHHRSSLSYGTPRLQFSFSAFPNFCISCIFCTSCNFHFLLVLYRMAWLQFSVCHWVTVPAPTAERRGLGPAHCRRLRSRRCLSARCLLGGGVLWAFRHRPLGGGGHPQ